MTTKDFIRFIKNARIRQGVSMEALAQMVGFSKSSVSMWESGERNMFLEQALDVLHALGYRFVIKPMTDNEGDFPDKNDWVQEEPTKPIARKRARKTDTPSLEFSDEEEEMPTLF